MSNTPSFLKGTKISVTDGKRTKRATIERIEGELYVNLDTAIIDGRPKPAPEVVATIGEPFECSEGRFVITVGQRSDWWSVYDALEIERVDEAPAELDLCGKEIAGLIAGTVTGVDKEHDGNHVVTVKRGDSLLGHRQHTIEALIASGDVWIVEEPAYSITVLEKPNVERVAGNPLVLSYRVEVTVPDGKYDWPVTVTAGRPADAIEDGEQIIARGKSRRVTIDPEQIAELIATMQKSADDLARAIELSVTESLNALVPAPEVDESDLTAPYGLAVGARYGDQPRSVVGAVDSTPIGNVAVRVGQETAPGAGSWHQTEYVVLTPREALGLITDLMAALKPAAAIVTGTTAGMTDAELGWLPAETDDDFELDEAELEAERIARDADERSNPVDHAPCGIDDDPELGLRSAGSF